MNNSNQAPGFIPQQMSKITIVSAVNGLFVCGPAVYKLAVTTPYTAALVTAPCLSRALHIVSGLCDSATKHNAVISITEHNRRSPGSDWSNGHPGSHDHANVELFCSGRPSSFSSAGLVPYFESKCGHQATCP